MKKESIRKKILSLRNSQSPFQAITKSYSIKQKIFTSPEFIRAKTILFYVSTKDEVKTKNMIKEALNLDKRVVVPISDVKNRKLILSELKDLDELEPGAFNILEPRKEFFRLVPPEDIDLVIVPGVAFDERGNRIGYGMGFYDRFLSSLKKHVPVVGLAYDFQVVDDISVDDKDVTVDKVVSEERIIKCD